MTMHALQWAMDIEGLLPIEKLVLIGLAERSGRDFETGQVVATASVEEMACFACCSCDLAAETLNNLLMVRVIGPGVDNEYPLLVGKHPAEVSR